MCAANPIAAWPAEPRRYSRRWPTLAGTRTLLAPNGGMLSSSRGRPCEVIAIGRVWAAAHGTLWTPAVRRTSARSTTIRTRGDEPLPLQVGLGAGEEQERGAVGVAMKLHGESRGFVGFPTIGVEEEHGPPRAVVEQLVDVEAGDGLGLERLRECSRASLTPCPASTKPSRASIRTGCPSGSGWARNSISSAGSLMCRRYRTLSSGARRARGPRRRASRAASASAGR